MKFDLLGHLELEYLHFPTFFLPFLFYSLALVMFEGPEENKLN